MSQINSIRPPASSYEFKEKWAQAPRFQEKYFLDMEEIMIRAREESWLREEEQKTHPWEIIEKLRKDIKEAREKRYDAIYQKRSTQKCPTPTDVQ